LFITILFTATLQFRCQKFGKVYFALRCQDKILYNNLTLPLGLSICSVWIE